LANRRLIPISPQDSPYPKHSDGAMVEKSNCSKLNNKLNAIQDYFRGVGMSGRLDRVTSACGSSSVSSSSLVFVMRVAHLRPSVSCDNWISRYSGIVSPIRKN